MLERCFPCIVENLLQEKAYLKFDFNIEINIDYDIFEREEFKMGILSGNPQNEPLHYGEVFDIWSYLLAAQGAVASHQVFMNHTGDEDLKKFLEGLIENDMNSEIEELKALLKVNGVALPPAPPERPVASIEDIPPGARINDVEIAAAVSTGLAAGLVTCSQVMGKCLREDVGMLFGQFHMKKAQAGVTLLRLSKKKDG